MKIKLFNDFINEAIINPIDTKDIIKTIKSIETITSLDEINTVLQEYGIKFTFYDEFYNSLETEEEKKVAPPKNMMSPSPIRFALFNKYINKINIVVQDRFIEWFNSKGFRNHFYTEVSEIIKHESIHRQQVGKMGIKNYHLTDSPVNPKQYFSNKSEIMAYANSFVIEMTKRKSKEEIISLLRNKNYIDNWIFDSYKRHVSKKDFQRFIKYIYLYLQEL